MRNSRVNSPGSGAAGAAGETGCEGLNNWPNSSGSAAETGGWGGALWEGTRRSRVNSPGSCGDGPEACGGFCACTGPLTAHPGIFQARMRFKSLVLASAAASLALRFASQWRSGGFPDSTSVITYGVPR